MVDCTVEFGGDTIRAPYISVADRDIGGRKNLLPADILLAVEIANSTLSEDIGRKRIDYATAGIRHYWVVDIEGRRTHTYADPQGTDYAALRVFAFGEPMSVLGAERSITVE